MVKCEISTDRNIFNLKGSKHEILAEWAYGLDYILRAVSSDAEDFECLKLSTMLAIASKINYTERTS